jgi:(R,R)-butanediol dehydrogenase / meso-butanediol dehydrogenase / diacetyl reductase
MRAAVYHGRRDVRVQDVVRPARPAEDGIVLNVTHASICGTDVCEFVHGPRMVPLDRRHPASGHLGPTILGHEMVGTVEAVGSSVSSVRPGDRVVPGAASWCGTCSRCREGRPNLCERYFVYGLHASGGLAEYVALPANMCHPVPAQCDDEAAVLAQPLAIALHAIRRSGARHGGSLAIVGAGGIGSFLVVAARMLRPEPLIAIDIDPERLALARRLGATVAVRAGSPDAGAAVRRTVSDTGVDVVIEASGTPAGLQTAVSLVRHGGRVHLVGLPSEPAPIDLHDCIVHEVTFSTSNGHVCETDLPEALGVLGATEIGALVVDRVIGLDRLVPDGLETMARHEAHGKIVVRLP